MANVVQTQILIDGPVNTVFKMTGQLDTVTVSPALESYTVKLNPATFTTSYKRPVTWRLDHVDYSISDGIEAQLFWDATTPVVIMPLSGRGRMSFWNFGGLQNNATNPGFTGGIALSVSLLPSATVVAGTPFVYSVILELVKQANTGQNYPGSLS